jgi:hypothetical protein
MALHRAYFEPGSLIVVLSPTDRQSGETVNKAKAFASQMGLPTRGDGLNRISLKLPNGSRIVGLPGRDGTVRGFSNVSLLLVDEAARVPEHAYKATRPMRAVNNGGLWLMSTPAGQRGFFWELWTKGGPRWTRLAIPATECPRISAEFLKEEREEMGDLWYRQEYLCEFVENGEDLLPRELVEKALDLQIEPMPPPNRWN